MNSIYFNAGKEGYQFVGEKLCFLMKSFTTNHERRRDYKIANHRKLNIYITNVRCGYLHYLSNINSCYIFVSMFTTIKHSAMVIHDFKSALGLGRSSVYTKIK